ncbi:MAG: DNA-deoxyinosine glycosylase [Alphaproteobacteria bacterium]|nr:DNA-deoxyinosine glycosylase [Alphaproteobacteria bacterium]
MTLASERAASAAPGKRSFAPLVDPRARVLVLGTLPGEESLRRQQYYAHPRNVFWRIIFGLFDATPPPDYAQRLTFAAAHRIALWDVCEIGERARSADTTIRLERPNAVDRLLDRHPLIRGIAFNGTTARRLHDRYFARRANLTYLALPSTSPAHATIDFTRKLACWRALREVLEAGEGGSTVHAG